MTLRRRWSWAGTALGSAALAAVAALSGCAPAAPANADAPTAHLLTTAQAQAGYASYLAASNAVAVQAAKDLAAADPAALEKDKNQALTVASFAQWAVVKSQYTAMANTGVPVPRYQYGTPVFYVPALSAYPEWFAAVAPRSTLSGGKPGSPVSTVLLFERAKPDTPWTLNGSTVLDQPLPAIARNSDGYAINVSSSDTGLLLAPNVVGATQAAVVDEGPASAAAPVVGPGPQTTGLYTAQAALASAATARGLGYQWLLQGAPFRQFQLRTADGGALVLYGMILSTTTTYPAATSGAPIAIPADVAALVPGETGYHAVWVNYTYQYVAIDPPANAPDAKLQVLGVDGRATYGHAD